MKVYFTASIAGKKLYLPNYLKIINIVKQKGIKITYEHIIDSSEEFINLETKESRNLFHKKLKKWVMDCSCAIVEVSFPSISVGFEISLALNLGKPVLILYTKEPPTLLSSYNDEKLICEKYTFNNLKSIIDDFIHYVRAKSNHQFTFFIPSKISHFLEEMSKKNNIPKSVYIRNLIQREIDK